MGYKYSTYYMCYGDMEQHLKKRRLYMTYIPQIGNIAGPSNKCQLDGWGLSIHHSLKAGFILSTNKQNTGEYMFHPLIKGPIPTHPLPDFFQSFETHPVTVFEKDLPPKPRAVPVSEKKHGGIAREDWGTLRNIREPPPLGPPHQTTL